MRLQWPPAWLLVLIGLMLNVLAILLASIVLEDLSSQIASLSERKEDNLYAIQRAWNSVETLERKRESVLLYIASPQVAEVAHTMSNQLRDWINAPIPLLVKQNVLQLMDLVDQAQRGYRDQIDDFYLQNLTISEQMMTLSDRITWYRNISLFLQVFGLALILARDLSRT